MVGLIAIKDSTKTYIDLKDFMDLILYINIKIIMLYKYKEIYEN